MMGGHHAITGAAVWLAMTAPRHCRPDDRRSRRSPRRRCSRRSARGRRGTRTGPGPPQATAAHSAGALSKIGTGLVGAVSGGHRHGTHAPIVAAAVVGAALWLDDWAGPSRIVHPSWWVCAAVICGSMAFALKVLRLIRRWPAAWITGAGTAAAVCLSWPGFLVHLPAIVAVGWCTHLAGDILTTGGLPLAWPFRIPGSCVRPDAIWQKNGYLALPVLGNAGSTREWVLCSAVSVYVRWRYGRRSTHSCRADGAAPPVATDPA